MSPYLAAALCVPRVSPGGRQEPSYPGEGLQEGTGPGGGMPFTVFSDPSQPFFSLFLLEKYI